MLKKRFSHSSFREKPALTCSTILFTIIIIFYSSKLDYFLVTVTYTLGYFRKASALKGLLFKCECQTMLRVTISDNTLAYYGLELIMALKRFIAWLPEYPFETSSSIPA